MENIMNKYETVILVSAIITDEQRNEVVSKIQKLISAKGKLIETEEKGKRKMAYEVKKHTEAFYYVLNFESEADFIAELQRNYRIIDEIIKFIVVKQDE